MLLTSQRREINRLRLMQSIERIASESGEVTDSPSAAGRRVRMARPASIAASLAAVILGSLLWVQNSYLPESDRATTFLTRSSISSQQPAPDGNTYRVVFQPHETADTIRSLLATLRAEVINGPSVTGVYTVAFGDRALSNEQRLEQLRREPAVLLAEKSVHQDW